MTHLCSYRRRLGQWCRRDVQIAGARRELHLRISVSKCTAEFLGCIIEVIDATRGRPFDLERNNRWNRLARIACYRILEVPIILNVKIVHFERCGARVQVDLNVSWFEDGRPEETILRDSRIEIVNLCAPQLGVVEIDSDK